jgi:hypothetical protein
MADEKQTGICFGSKISEIFQMGHNLRQAIFIPHPKVEVF